MSQTSTASTVFALWLAASRPTDGSRHPYENLLQVTGPADHDINITSERLLSPEPAIAQRLEHLSTLAETQNVQDMMIQQSGIMPALILGRHLGRIRPDESVLSQTIQNMEGLVNAFESDAARRLACNFAFEKSAYMLIIVASLEDHWRSRGHSSLDATNFDFDQTEN
ncbi:hypothetical protein B0H19DRAFT_54787 [Mycena capillaripes]|nr:hypothetical protein B0H19DRAFT_54787 [Mycena capillaripes]